MPDYILKRPSECNDGEVVYDDGETVLVAVTVDLRHDKGMSVAIASGPGLGLRYAVERLCDLRDRAEKAERELAKAEAELAKLVGDPRRG